MGRRAKKLIKDGETSRQQDGSCAEISSGRRRGRKEKEKDLIDLAVRDLVLNIAENDNIHVPGTQRFRQVALVDYLQRSVESMYPQIGRETYRVPDVHINKGKDREVNEEGVTEQIPPTDTDIRSDRAHSFITDMIYHLSTQMKETTVGPFFIISSYEYDHFLSRLKSSIEEKYFSQELDVNFPKGSGHDRGEIDILIALPKHVIFVEIKAIGDNFHEYGGDKGTTIKDNIKKATNQLLRDEQVFDHVMADLNLQDFKKTKIAAFPNLEREYLRDALDDDELRQKCQGCLFLCKENMPKCRLQFLDDFHKFQTWWINNVFLEIAEDQVMRFAVGQDSKLQNQSDKQSDEGQGEAGQRSALDEVKVIVGRYVGFMSVVKVCNSANSKLHRIEGRVEGRHKGQMVWYVGERFANIVLTPDQKSYLDTDIKLGYLCGPPGSGKTVVLSLRARRWILNEGNFVVVVNMYRGAPGRAIGKHILKTITENSDESKEITLRKHTLEIGVDVGANRFQRQEFVDRIRSRWGDEIGQCGDRILFVVDETYVQTYWDSVFQTLRQEFANSAMWCAGLYGKQPDRFTSLKLTKVIRCPPSVQHILSLIDWVDDRKHCYITDSTKAALPTNGPRVLTVRHQNHTAYVHLPPAHCPLCGSDMVHIFKRLQIRLPEKGHTDPDLQLWSLRCSDIVILVNLPRALYRQDEAGYLDTTVDRYKTYMQALKNCVLLDKLRAAGYPTRVHTDLSCGQLVTQSTQEVINITWIYTYQGLENKVIIFLPGDEAMPQYCNEEYLTEPSLNIPCPGLMASEDEAWKEKTEQCEHADSGGCVSGGNSESDGVSEEETGPSADSDDIVNDRQTFMRDTDVPDGSGQAASSRLTTSAGSNCHDTCLSMTSMEEHMFNTADVQHYTRWDKSNLFISASRCTSQLILITR